MERNDLEKKAKELGIAFSEETSDTDLEGNIKEKEKEIEENSKKDGDPEYLRSELKKVIEQRDLAKKDKNALKKKIENLEKSLEEAVSKTEFDSIKTKLDELESFKNKTDKEKEEAELAKLNEIERANLRAKKAEENAKKEVDEATSKVVTDFQKQLDEFKTKLDSKDTQIEKLRKNSLESEIIDIASKQKAISPSHIYRMLRNEFEYDADLAKYIHPVKDEKGKLIDEQNVSEFVKAFLEDKENDYLINSGANREPMYTKTTTTTKTTTGEYSRNDPELKKKAAEESMDIDSYIRAKQAKDKKMAKIKEEREKLL